MASVTIAFEFQNDQTVYEDFEADGDMEFQIEEYAEEKAKELCSEFKDYEPSDWNLDYDIQSEPGDFDSLDEWGAYCELVEEHGEAYVHRFDDGIDSMDGYEGSFDSDEDFVKNSLEDSYDLPSFIYIDWERTAQDVMMDYSSYDGSNSGVYIFRD